MSYILLNSIVGILIGLWMYSDAKKRKLDNPGVWIWIGLLLGVIGLAFYVFWHVLPRGKVKKEKEE